MMKRLMTTLAMAALAGSLLTASAEARGDAGYMAGGFGADHIQSRDRASSRDLGVSRDITRFGSFEPGYGDGSNFNDCPSRNPSHGVYLHLPNCS